MGNHLFYGRNLAVGGIVRIMIGLIILLFASNSGFAQDPPAPDPQPEISEEDNAGEEKEIAEMAQMLQLMEILENMELMEDLDIFNGEDTNEKEN